MKVRHDLPDGRAQLGTHAGDFVSLSSESSIIRACLWLPRLPAFAIVQASVLFWCQNFDRLSAPLILGRALKQAPLELVDLPGAIADL